MLRQLGMVGHEPLEGPLELRQPVDGFFFQGRDGNQRQQADHGADLHPDRLLAVYLNLIEVKSVFIVPQAACAQHVHGIAELDEMFEKFGRHIPVCDPQPVPVVHQLHGHGRHGEAIKGHPCRTVGLLKRAAGRDRKRFGPIKDADVIEAQQAA